MILLTGAAGFIGSNLLKNLNEQKDKEVIIVDDFRGQKVQNLLGLKYSNNVHRDQLFDWLSLNGSKITAVYHLGARTDTTEKSHQIFHQLNLSYSKRIWKFCTEHQLPLLYASSAATYGMGEYGFEDNHNICRALQPLNPYAVSKNEFDKWAINQTAQPPFWAGLKFFNVYGSNEYHKGRMASVVYHAYQQIKETGEMKLFRSHRSDIQDGFQSRDFIYVEDIVQQCSFFMNHQPANGLYNAGTGKARTFLDLVRSTFKAMNEPEKIQFIDTPIDIRATYQYFTEANMNKTIQAGYKREMLSLEEGVKSYINLLRSISKENKTA